MQQQTCTTAGAHVQVGSLWIDHAHHHRLVEVIQIADEDHVRLRPVRESHRQPPSFLADTARLGSDFHRVAPCRVAP